MTKYPHAEAFLKKTGLTLDEALEYFEQLERKVSPWNYVLLAVGVWVYVERELWFTGSVIFVIIVLLRRKKVFIYKK